MLRVAVLCAALLAAEGAFEGDICEYEGAAGVCTNLRKCAPALDEVRRGKKPPVCTWDENIPVVCCVQPAAPPATSSPRPALTTTGRAEGGSTTEFMPPVNDYEPLEDRRGGCQPIPPALTANRTGQKAWDKCVEWQETLVYPCERTVALSGDLGRVNRCHHNADDLIVGGIAASKDEFPHMALLGFGDDPAQLAWQCGGALISDKFVMTAGHCTASREYGAVSHVVLRTARRSDDLSGVNRYKVKRIVKHPAYQPPSKYNDIALLELERTVPLDEFTVPACLHGGEPVDDSRASATGWGVTQYQGATSDVLQKVVLTKFETSECAAKYRANRLLRRGFDAETQTCYGDRQQSKDTCQGDSGGPLQVKNKRIACMYTVVGVTSFGLACGFVGQPGVYTRVAHYLPWIESVVWP